MIRKILMSAVAAIAMLAVSVSATQAFEGGWYFDNNAGGWEVLSLGDNSDDTYLHLSGYTGWCGSRGASYAKMRRVIGSNAGDQIHWWIDADCGSTARVCVENAQGSWACSTYRVEGWSDWQ